MTFASQLLARVKRLLDGNVRDLAKNASWLAFAQVGKLGIGLLQVSLVVRLLGVREYGRLAVVMSVTAFVSAFVGARVWEWVNLRFAEAVVDRDARMASAVFRYGLILSRRVNLAAFAFIALLSPFVGRIVSTSRPVALEVVLFAGTLLATWANDTSSSVLRVLGRYRWISIHAIATTVVRATFLILPLFVGLRLRGVIAGYVLSEIVSSASLFVLARRAFETDLGSNYDCGSLDLLASRSAESRRLLLTSFGIDTLKSVCSQADLLILGAIAGETPVGLYKAAQNVVDVGNRLAGVLLQSTYPSLARLAAEAKLDELFRLVRRSSVTVGALVVSGSALVSLLAGPLVRVAYGRGHDEIALLLRVQIWSLVWAIAFWAAAVPMSLGRSDLALRFTVVTQTLRLAMIVAASVLWGAIGLSWANASYAAVFVMIAIGFLGRVRRETLSRNQMSA